MTRPAIRKGFNSLHAARMAVGSERLLRQISGDMSPFCYLSRMRRQYSTPIDQRKVTIRAIKPTTGFTLVVRENTDWQTTTTSSESRGFSLAKPGRSQFRRNPGPAAHRLDNQTAELLSSPVGFPASQELSNLVLDESRQDQHNTQRAGVPRRTLRCQTRLNHNEKKQC